MSELTLHKELHVKYVAGLNELRDSYEYWITEHLRMNGTYWGLLAMALVDRKEVLDRDGLIEFVMKCFNKDGGFGLFPRHDSHLSSTLSAVQILKIIDAMDVLDSDKVLKISEFVKNLQLPDGSFQGDRFGEIDTRFVYSAVNCLSLLDSLTPEILNKAALFVQQCENFDGGYGMVPGAESHSAQIFVCVATLAICERLDLVNRPNVLQYLSERQVANGGLNGRPEKLPDVCYSWWVLSSLAVLDSLDVIDQDKLRNFIYRAQDPETGGIADREDNQVDVYHTYFGLAGLSLMKFDNLVPIDPVYALPCSLTTDLVGHKHV